MEQVPLKFYRISGVRRHRRTGLFMLAFYAFALMGR